MEKSSFSNVQKELLKMFHNNVPESQLLEVRKLFSDYFAKKASDEADRLWNEKGWSDKTMESWTHEHMRSGQ